MRWQSFLLVLVALTIVSPQASARLAYGGIPDLVVKVGGMCYHVWPPGDPQPCCVPKVTCDFEADVSAPSLLP